MSIEERIRESFGRQSLMRTIDASITAISHGKVEITLPARSDLAQQHGFLHAAIVTAILDTACGYAALTTMPAGCEVLSVEFKVNFVAPAIGDRFVARASVKRAGRTLVVTEGDCFSVRQGEEKLIATMLGTMIRTGGGGEDGRP